MDVYFTLHGVRFVWDHAKARANAAKHGVTFETTCEAFFDPFLSLTDAGRHEERTDWPSSERRNADGCCSWSTWSGKRTCSGSSRLGTPPPRNGGSMKIADLKKRLVKDRPMTSVTLRMPEDVVEDLKRIAPLLGFSGYQPLARHYIGQGLRADLARLEDPPLLGRLVESLKRHGVDENVIADAVAETIPDRQSL